MNNTTNSQPPIDETDILERIDSPLDNVNASRINSWVNRTLQKFIPNDATLNLLKIENQDLNAPGTYKIFSYCLEFNGGKILVIYYMPYTTSKMNANSAELTLPATKHETNLIQRLKQEIQYDGVVLFADIRKTFEAIPENKEVQNAFVDLLKLVDKEILILRLKMLGQVFSSMLEGDKITILDDRDTKDLDLGKIFSELVTQIQSKNKTKKEA